MSRIEAPSFHMLIIEDDPATRVGLRDFFELEGFAVTTAADGEEALERMQHHPAYDIVLLDVMLPKKSGLDVLRTSRSRGMDLPVLLLTALNDERYILEGFALGATDYVTKPFNTEILVARVNAILQRTKPPAQAPMDIWRAGSVEVNFSTHQAYCDGVPIDLTPQEFDLLHYLIQNRGRTITRAELLERVWGVPATINTRTIDRHMASLRKKIEAPSSRHTLIETIRGKGYRLVR